MERDRLAARIAFASGMMFLGVLGLVYRDFAMEWQPRLPTNSESVDLFEAGRPDVRRERIVR